MKHLNSALVKTPVKDQGTPPNEASLSAKILIAFLLFLCHIVSYADRFNISIAILHMSAEFGYSPGEQGHIFAAFFYGYIVTQAIAGSLTSTTSRVGPKSCLIFACTAWSIITILTPFCADHSFAMLIIARVALGAAEGLYIPACVALIASWYPPHERATVSAIGHVGQCLGAVCAMSCAPLAAYNWRLLFYRFGSLGLVWAAVFYALGSDGPGRVKSAAPLASTPDIEDHLYGSTCVDMKRKDASYGAILATPAFWAVAAGHFAYNWSWYLMLSWLPRYMVQTYSVSMSDVGHYALWPYMAAGCFCILWARIADCLLLNGKLSLLSARKTSALVSCLGPICALSVLLFMGTGRTVIFAVGLISVAVGVQTAGMSGFAANMVDIGGVHNAGRVAAASNTIGTLPGAIGNILVGALLGDWGGGWSAVFGTMIVVHALGLAIFVTFASGDELDF